MNDVDVTLLLDDHAWGEHKNLKISICPKCKGTARDPYAKRVALTATDVSSIQARIEPPKKRGNRGKRQTSV